LTQIFLNVEQKIGLRGGIDFSFLRL